MSLEGFGEAVIRFRIWVILVSLLLTAAGGAGMFSLSYDPNSRLFFAPDDPKRMALDQVEDDFSKANSVSFIVVPGEGSLFTPRMLQLIEELTERAWHTPHSFRVDSLSNHSVRSAEGDDILVSDLYENAAELSPTDIAQIKEEALSDDTLVGLMISESGDVGAVNVLVQTPDEDARAAIISASEFAYDLAEEFEAAYPGTEIKLSGGIIADFTFADAARRDSRSLVPAMIVTIIVVLSIGLRSWIAVLSTMVIVAISTLIALGCGGYFGYNVNAATAGTPVIVMTLCVADCVHLLTTLSHRRGVGDSRRQAIVNALKLNLQPIAITSLTTAIGFLTLNFGKAPPLGELGNMVAIGVTCGFIFSVTTLPAMLSFFSSPGAPLMIAGKRSMLRLATISIDRKWLVLAVFILAAPPIIAGMNKIIIDDNFVEYFDDRFAFRADTDFMEDRLTGIHVLLYPVPAGEAGGISQPDYLRRIDAFADWFKAQPEVTSVSSLSRSIKDINQVMNGDDPAFYRIPDSAQQVAENIFLLEMSMPFGLDLSTYINVDRSATLLTVRLAQVGSADVQRISLEGEAWLRENAPDFAVRATGLSVLYSYMTAENVRAMLTGTFLAFALVSAILLLVLRDLRLGLISLVPNLLPAALIFGLWGYVGGEVNLAISVIGAMTFGIIVDDTVHFLTKYRWARTTLGLRPASAVRKTFIVVGPALIMTSVALVTGFLILSQSGFAVSSLTGILSAMTLTSALLTDLLLLPAVLLILSKGRGA